MWKFDYLEFVLRGHFECAPPAMTYRDIWVPCMMITLIIWYRMRHRVSKLMETRVLYITTSSGILESHILIRHQMFQDVYLGQLIRRY